MELKEVEVATGRGPQDEVYKNEMGRPNPTTERDDYEANAAALLPGHRGTARKSMALTVLSRLGQDQVSALA